MYPGSIFEYDDQSMLSQNNVDSNTVRNVPLLAAVFTSDKGPEGWNRVTGSQFFEAYGNNISFARHGQPLLQAAASINAGAELLCKRLVSDDATLANIVIIGTVKKENNKATISFRTASVPNIKTTSAKDVYTKAISNDDDNTITLANTADTKEHILYVITDIGRGVSNKKIKIIADHKLSKSLGYTLYTLYVMENNTVINSLTFSINPNMISQNQNISLRSMVSTYSKHINCYSNDKDMDDFVKDILSAAGLRDNTDTTKNVSIDEFYRNDLLFGKTYKGEDIIDPTATSTGTTGAGTGATGTGTTGATTSKIVLIGADSKSLDDDAGFALLSGTNGTFGSYMADESETAITSYNTEFTTLAKAALDGTADPIIFNKDQHKIYAIVDANYPADVKRAIEELADFREDFVYLRDQNLGVTSIDSIKSNCLEESKSKFCATYCQSYDIIDPYSKRQITVTIGYDLASCIVRQYNNSPSTPLAGIMHDVIIKNAIYGTLSFAPSVLKDNNQKETLCDMHVNFATYIDNILVVETEYTSQEEDTQWSFINNVLGIQEVIRAIRTRCPYIRYTFIERSDFERYQADVNEVLDKYRNNFKILTMEYAANAEYTTNKIFYAVIKACYKNFIQTEIFKITAINNQ